MRSVIRNIPMTMIAFIAIIAIMLAGCVSTSSDNTRSTIDTNTCSENLYFWDHYQRVRYSTCEQQACGEPLEADDVLVVKIDDGESVEAVVDARLGPNARYIDQWYLAGDLTTEHYLNRVKREFAAKGCNLLIVGDEIVRGTLDQRHDSRSVRTQFRWGSY